MCSRPNKCAAANNCANDGNRLQAWRSCRVELGGGAGPGHDPEESNLRDRLQGLQAARLDGGAAVHHQERQDRPPSHPQGVGFEEDQEKQRLTSPIVATASFLALVAAVAVLAEAIASVSGFGVRPGSLSLIDSTRRVF